MMKRHILLYTLVALALQSCVHYWPTEEEEQQRVEADVRCYLRFEFDTELPIYKELVVSRAAADVEQWDVRYVIEAYQYNNGSYSSTPYLRTTILDDADIETLDRTVDLKLTTGRYRIVAWTEYIPHGTDDDYFYETSNFRDVCLTQAYEGNTDWRDGYCGQETCDLTVSDNEAVVYMGRPMGKFTFIVPKPDFSTEGYTCTFVYKGFVPTAYSIFSQMITDTSSGLTFSGELTDYENSDEYLKLGFDYVFCGDSETTVTVSLYIYDGEGELVSSSTSIDVPLMKSMHTIISGDFLNGDTSDGGGVGIIPDYWGDYNIEYTDW